MQKISNTVLQRMIGAGLSSLEINFMLVVCRRQSPDGTVQGVYYRDITEELGCSFQQFYNILRSLENKGIIYYEKASYYDYDIVILNNAVPDGGKYENGYISLAKGMYCKDFMKLKAGAKLLAMELLRRQDIQFRKIKKPSLCFNIETLHEKFCQMLSVTKRVLLYYLKELREFFSIGIKDGKYYITPLKRSYNKADESSDTARVQENEVRTCCRRNRISLKECDENAVKDTAYLMTQYYYMALEQGIDSVKLVLKMIVESVNKEGKYKARKRQLQAPLIHKLVRQKIDSHIVPEGCGAQ